MLVVNIRSLELPRNSPRIRRALSTTTAPRVQHRARHSQHATATASHRPANVANQPFVASPDSVKGFDGSSSWITNVIHERLAGVKFLGGEANTVTRASPEPTRSCAAGADDQPGSEVECAGCRFCPSRRVVLGVSGGSRTILRRVLRCRCRSDGRTRLFLQWPSPSR